MSVSAIGVKDETGFYACLIVAAMGEGW